MTKPTKTKIQLSVKLYLTNDGDEGMTLYGDSPANLKRGIDWLAKQVPDLEDLLGRPIRPVSEWMKSPKKSPARKSQKVPEYTEAEVHAIVAKIKALKKKKADQKDIEDIFGK